MMKKHKSIPAIVKHLRPDLLGKKKPLAQFKMDGDGEENRKKTQPRIIDLETPSEGYLNLSIQNNWQSSELEERGEREDQQNMDDGMEDYSIGPYEFNFDSEMEFNCQDSHV